MTTRDEPVYLKDIWPTSREIADAIAIGHQPANVPRQVRERFYTERALEQNRRTTGESVRVGCQINLHCKTRRSSRTSVRTTPRYPGNQGASVLALLGDSVTTDHISPAGNISDRQPPANTCSNTASIKRLQLLWLPSRPSRSHDARYVREHPDSQPGCSGHRRRRHEVSAYRRSHIRLRWIDEISKNRNEPHRHRPAKNTEQAAPATGRPKARSCSASKPLSPKASSGFTAPTWSAWAFCPLQFQEGHSWKTLDITGPETFDIVGMNNDVKPGDEVTVIATREDGSRSDSRLRFVWTPWLM